MEAWHLWLLAGLFLMILELLGTGFVAFALGLAALAGMIAALLHLPAAAQWISFAIAAAVLAPWLRKKFQRWAPSRRRSGLAGEKRTMEGLLLLDNSGQLKVKVESDTYFVRSLSDRNLTPGTRVTVVDFDGITALVD
ncbi:NfeD family protein [Nitrincola schmidtii]|uniref:NfeD family protein n=1 Tax=Nitrincola schmidtii TaxID=1730894 RepID=UPI00124E93A4|nr:NfeD family protein [Nitrincola schmidtii]